MLAGKSNNTSETHNEALLCVNSDTCCVLSEQCFSICQEPVLALLILEQHVPLQEWINFPFMFTCHNLVSGNVQTQALSLGKCRKDVGEGK